LTLSIFPYPAAAGPGRCRDLIGGPSPSHDQWEVGCCCRFTRQGPDAPRAVGGRGLAVTSPAAAGPEAARTFRRWSKSRTTWDVPLWTPCSGSSAPGPGNAGTRDLPKLQCRDQWTGLRSSDMKVNLFAKAWHRSGDPRRRPSFAAIIAKGGGRYGPTLFPGDRHQAGNESAESGKTMLKVPDHPRGCGGSP